MPIAGIGSAIGALVAAAVGTPPDGIPAAASAWGKMLDTIGLWVPANVVVLPGTMVGSGGSVNGTGIFQFSGTGAELGPKLAAALGATDAASIARWTLWADTFLDFWEVYGVANPTGFTYPSPAGGPVVGTSGTVSFSAGAPVLGAAWANAVSPENPLPSVAPWTSMASTLLPQIETLAQFLATPIGLVGADGGPLTGTGTIV